MYNSSINYYVNTHVGLKFFRAENIGKCVSKDKINKHMSFGASSPLLMNFIGLLDLLINLLVAIASCILFVIIVPHAVVGS